MKIEQIIQKNPEYQFLIEVAYKTTFWNNSFSDEEKYLIINDFIDQFGADNLKYFNESFEGTYENFKSFAKEFHEDCENDDLDFDDEYIQELNSYYIFLHNSKAVFKNL